MLMSFKKKDSGMVQSQIKESKRTKETKKLNATHDPWLELGGGGGAGMLHGTNQWQINYVYRFKTSIVQMFISWFSPLYYGCIMPLFLENVHCGKGSNTYHLLSNGSVGGKKKR